MLFVIKSFNLNQFEELEDIKVNSIYDYIDDKINQIFQLKLVRSLFVYYVAQDGHVDEFCLLKTHWCSHSILKLILSFPRTQENLAKYVKNKYCSELVGKIKDAFK